MNKMKKITHFALAAALVLAADACASSGGGAVADGDLTLDEAIEQAAGDIAGGLPAGTRVAIVAFESESEQLSDYIMDELTFALVKDGMEVAERDNLDYVLKELNLQYTGNFSEESMQSIGKWLGAQSVISGELVHTGGRYRFRVNPISVEKAVRKKEYDKAIADSTQAIRLDPNYAAAYNNRGATYSEKGDYDRAIADCTQAIKFDPNFALAYHVRGCAYGYKGDYDKAIADFEKALKINPNFELAKKSLATVRQIRGW